MIKTSSPARPSLKAAHSQPGTFDLNQISIIIININVYQISIMIGINVYQISIIISINVNVLVMLIAILS